MNGNLNGFVDEFIIELLLKENSAKIIRNMVRNFDILQKSVESVAMNIGKSFDYIMKKLPTNTKLSFAGLMSKEQKNASVAYMKELGQQYDKSIRRKIFFRGDNKQAQQNITDFFNNMMPKANEGMKKFGKSISETTKKARKFNMEMLGVMFFGMAMTRFFKGLLNPAMKTTGIFELFGSTLEILFLPTVLSLIEPLTKLLNFVASMPDPLKKAIGGFALLGMAIGTVLAVWGQFSLGINSLLMTKLLSNITTKSEEATVAVGGLSARMTKFGKSLKPGGAIGKVFGAGLAIGAFIRMFHKDWKTTTPTVGDWLTNLGMTTAAGFMIGGGTPQGAIAGFAIGAVVQLVQASVRKYLRDVEQLKKDTSKILTGSFTSEEAMKAYKYGYQGTLAHPKPKIEDILPRDVLNNLGYVTVPKFNESELYKTSLAENLQEQQLPLINIQQTLNINAIDTDEIKRVVNEANNDMVSQIYSNIG